MRSEKKLFYGWFIVGAAFLVLFAINGGIINTFGVFLKPVSEDMGWTRTLFTGILGLGALGMALGSPFAGKVIDKFGVRKTMAFGVVLCGAGLALTGGATEMWHFIVLFFIVGIGFSASSMLPASVVIANWFNLRRGVAMGIAFMGTSFGGAIMNPVNTRLVLTYGWRTSYVIIGLGVMIISVPLILLFIRTRPSDMGLLPDGEAPSQKEPEISTGHTLSDAIRTSAFWLISINMFLTNFMANGVINHGIPHLTDIGHSPTFAGRVTGLSMLAMTLGKVSLGLCADRWGARPTFALSAVMTAVGVGILIMAGQPWLAVLYAIVFGFPQGGPLALTPLVAADCHGLANFGSIFGAMTFFSILGAGVGPIVIAAMYESSGSYTSAFTLLIVITLISAACIYMARPSKGLAFESANPD